MKICVYGAGAVGGHVAARLAAGGNTISLIARGEELTAIQRDGLRVTTSQGELISHPVVTDQPADLGRQDLVIVAIKAPVLPLVAKNIGGLLGDESLALFIVNGVPWWYGQPHDRAPDGIELALLDPDGLLHKHVGPDRTAGAVAYTAGTVVTPGVVLAQNPRNRLVVGRPDGRPDAKLDLLAEVLTPTGLEVEVTSHIRDAVWSKLLVNLVGGSLGILTESPTANLMGNPAIAAAARTMMGELAGVAKALGCDAGDPAVGLGGLERSARLQSVVQDLQAGRPLEVDAMFRAPLELARASKVPMPITDFVVELVIQRALAREV